MHASFGGLHRVVLIMDRTSRAGQIKDLVNFDVKWKCNVVSHELEAWVTQEMGHIVLATSVKIVDAQNIITASDKAVAEM